MCIFGSLNKGLLAWMLKNTTTSHASAGFTTPGTEHRMHLANKPHSAVFAFRFKGNLAHDTVYSEGGTFLWAWVGLATAGRSEFTQHVNEQGSVRGRHVPALGHPAAAVYNVHTPGLCSSMVKYPQLSWLLQWSLHSLKSPVVYPPTGGVTSTVCIQPATSKLPVLRTARKYQCPHMSGHMAMYAAKLRPTVQRVTSFHIFKHLRA